MAKRPITEVYGHSDPDPEFPCGGVGGYLPMLTGEGWEVVKQHSTGDYQGQDNFLLRDPDTGRYGFVAIAYGSCSGCDALQGCHTWADVDLLRDSIHSDIHWETHPGNLAVWLEARDWETQAAYYGDGVPHFIQECISFLLSMHFDEIKALRNP